MDGKILMSIGKSRSGKTVWVKRQLMRYSRVLVWDVEGQYADNPGFIRITDRKQLVAVCKVARQGRFAFVPKSVKEFGFWADCAFLFARVGRQTWRDRVHSAIVAEEIADVTSPAKAPDEWGILLRRGLKYGVDIYGITQRPQESDKTCMGNASEIHLCKLQRPGDIKYMAEEMDIPPAEIRSLVMDRKNKIFEYLHKDVDADTVERGRLTF
jgi:hypothetical protein